MSGHEPVLGLVLVGAGRAGHREAVLAEVGAVPHWFRPTDDPNGPHVAWVFGDEPEWPSYAARALAAGAAAVVVDEPWPADPEGLAALEAADHRVVVTSGWSHAPQVRALAGLVAPVRELVTLVEVLLVGSAERAPAAILGGALFTLAAAGLGVDRVDQGVVRPTALTAEAGAGDTTVHLTCVRNPRATPRLRIAAFGSFGSLMATAADPLVAAPGEVVTVTAEGARLLPSNYRTPRRIALGDAREAVLRGSRPTPSLSEYARSARLALQVTHEAIF